MAIVCAIHWWPTAPSSPRLNNSSESRLPIQNVLQLREESLVCACKAHFKNARESCRMIFAQAEITLEGQGGNSCCQGRISRLWTASKGSLPPEPGSVQAGGGFPRPLEPPQKSSFFKPTKQQCFSGYAEYATESCKQYARRFQHCISITQSGAQLVEPAM